MADIHKQTTFDDPLKKRLRPRVYSIGLYVVGFFILVQIGALVSIFWFRQTIIDTQGPALELDRPRNTERAAPPTLPDLPMPTMEARLPVDSGRTPQNEINRLTQDAYEFQRNGDFTLAEAALKEAAAIDADHPLVLTNFALLEEARGNNHAAQEYWRRIIALGGVAEGTVELARQRSRLIEERMRLEETRRLEERLIAGGESRRVVLDGITTTPDPLPSFPVEIQRDFRLRRAATAEDIQPAKLTVKLYFYDQIDADRLVPAKIEARFLNSPPDWSKNEIEVLRARYQAGPAVEGVSRHYYGYLLRVYYDNQLQIEHAEPIGLLKLMPPPRP